MKPDNVSLGGLNDDVFLLCQCDEVASGLCDLVWLANEGKIVMQCYSVRPCTFYSLFVEMMHRECEEEGSNRVSLSHAVSGEEEVEGMSFVVVEKEGRGRAIGPLDESPNGAELFVAVQLVKNVSSFSGVESVFEIECDAGKLRVRRSEKGTSGVHGTLASSFHVYSELYG
jgi:hypothetical protein